MMPFNRDPIAEEQVSLLEQRVLESSVSRRTLLKVMGVAMASSLLAACGDDDDGGDDDMGDATEPSGAAEPTEAPAEEETPDEAEAPGEETPDDGTEAPGEETPDGTDGEQGEGPGSIRPEIVIAQGSDISNVDPHLSTSTPDVNVYFNLYDPLTMRDIENNLIPHVAESWEIDSETNRTWTFTIRQGITFHNGDPLTAESVKFTVEAIQDPERATSVAGQFSGIESVEVVDEYTVQMTTEEPDPLLPTRWSNFGALILPEKYITEQGWDAFQNQPIGSGPLKFVEWRRDDELVTEGNENYWLQEVPFTRVGWVARPDTSSRISALIAGEVDIAVVIPPDQVETIEDSEFATTTDAFYQGLYIYCINTETPPLDKKEVRQALSLAVDRDAIVNDLWLGYGIVPNGPIPNTDIGYDPDLPPLAYDPDQAQALLEQAGYADEEIIIHTTSGYVANDGQLAESVQAMWQNVGINAQIEVLEYTVRVQRLREHAFTHCFFGNPTSTLLDPDGMLWRLMQPGGSYAYWRNDEWDELMSETRYIVDMEERAANYRQAAQIMNEEVPWIIFIQPRQIWGKARDLPWQARTDDIVILMDMVRNSS